ncbi:hypothetical protein P872_10675 [Rhodonellum psychrophilum GCM71 = DSM 17998]|uniref:HNH nuclease domain-containing protein n=2 Tax=Rhodonellum TaxID=336827 RepID=U5BUZ3_9BACT|nr:MULTISPECIES: HNH endonuclease [Rhodonellum]ERM81339.1 hypothetical protein P872_10675 [Rhodonellum psychrophilum GCM71 = DSM 17998]SDY62240.1 putative restriction endonuclease [Rhodonellum ikkaensis]
MKEGQKLWNREELILAINLYWKLPFGKIHQRNQEVIKLAQLIGRSPSSVVYKLGNFGSFDPTLKNRGVGGLKNASKLDKTIWIEFYNDLENSSYESEVLRAKLEKTTVEQMNNLSEDELPKAGIVRDRIVKVRVNQAFFRKSILASYGNTCCISGLNHPDFLVAGHIVPWSVDEKNRLNPRNGICINPLHDRAFELGYITIDLDYRIRISPKINDLIKNDDQLGFFKKHDRTPMILPGRYSPDPEFLKYHMEERFKG